MSISSRATLCADGGKHEWFVARMRGSRIRHQCSKCGHMDPWVKTPSKKSKSQVIRTLDVPKSSEPRTLHESRTVAELRTIAKQQGIRGYSKMTKQDLINVLNVVQAVG